MPTQRWRWRPWRVLRQATGAVEAVPPDTGHLIPRLLFFYSFFFFLSARIQLQLLHKKLDAEACFFSKLGLMLRLVLEA
ncbi:unnamed protein product [Sphagnum balticum]